MELTLIIVLWVIVSGIVSSFFSDREIGSGVVFLLSLFLSPIIGILIGLSSKRIEEVQSTTSSSFGRNNPYQNRKDEIINRLEEIKRLEIVELASEGLSKEKEELKREYQELEKSKDIKKKESLYNTITYYSNGNIKEKGNKVNGRWDGIYMKYYSNGKINKRIEYKNGKMSGNYERYSKNGKLESKGRYINFMFHPD